MKGNWRQWIAAFLMGVMMPGIALCFGMAVTPGAVSVQPTEQTQPSQLKQTLPQFQENGTIPVLHDDLLQIMNLEAYLVGVVLAEMPATFELQALKAQAVAARTCALQCTQEGKKHPGGAVCTDSKCCQAYIAEDDYRNDGGSREDIEKIRKAVQGTAGQVLTYEGELIEATYFSCSGGRTEDAVAVWGIEVPYLHSVESPGEESAEVYSHTVAYTASEFSTLLGEKLIGSPDGWLGSVTYTRGGGVETMVVAGKSYTGTQLRGLLALNSTAFTMMVDDGKIIITTSGRGHRVGMSQYGADAMAVKGKNYEEILTYYYQGAELTNWTQ